MYRSIFKALLFLQTHCTLTTLMILWICSVADASNFCPLLVSNGAMNLVRDSWQPTIMGEVKRLPVTVACALLANSCKWRVLPGSSADGGSCLGCTNKKEFVWSQMGLIKHYRSLMITVESHFNTLIMCLSLLEKCNRSSHLRVASLLMVVLSHFLSLSFYMYRKCLIIKDWGVKRGCFTLIIVLFCMCSWNCRFTTILFAQWALFLCTEFPLGWKHALLWVLTHW